MIHHNVKALVFIIKHPLSIKKYIVLSTIQRGVVLQFFSISMHQYVNVLKFNSCLTRGESLAAFQTQFKTIIFDSKPHAVLYN